jgi:hypothetical protein
MARGVARDAWAVVGLLVAMGCGGGSGSSVADGGDTAHEAVEADGHPGDDGRDDGLVGKDGSPLDAPELDADATDLPDLAQDAPEPPPDAPDPTDLAEDAPEPPPDAPEGADPSEVADTAPDADAAEVTPPSPWGPANAWSWNGSWTPADADFPLPCLFDDEYFDGHTQPDGWPTKILPPGAWDWNDAADDYANWGNFESQIGHFEPLVDPQGRQFGWRLVGHAPDAIEMDGPAGYFEGSCGVDLLDLGSQGSLHSYGQGSLGDGPDVLRVTTTWSLDFRTGSDATGHAHDDDLVLAGGAPNADDAFDLSTCTLHTGPGNDLVFVRDIERSAIDLGNGANGRTDTLDPDDGDDVALVGGNTLDFRVFGGWGDDIEVWYVDENIQSTWWLGPNFFGGGGFTGALWEDPGTDRLVLAVPTDTLVRLSPTTATPPGALSVLGTNGQWMGDDPTVADPHAAYCVECGEGPGGRRTIIFEYRSADDTVFTAYFYVTAMEELQLGLGPQARVFTIDDVHGTLIEAPGAPVFEPPAWPAGVTWSPGA